MRAQAGFPFFSLAFITLIGCGTPMAADSIMAEPASTASLDGSEWTLVELRGQPAFPASAQGRPHLAFSAADSQVSGSTGCNSFSGSYVQDGAMLRITGPLRMTRRACAERERNEQERRFTAMLEATDSFAIHDDTLLLYSEGDTAARFSAGVD
ncbi:MAG TPA: META domain-containing protein [Thermoanaerobaculia bacterium]|nr:META domain-containing protein [Thermoanaerobaculia bacterium]